METLGIWTNTVYNGKEIDNWKKRLLCESLDDLLNYYELLKCNIDNGDVLHIHIEYNDEDITSRALNVINEYKKLLKAIDDLSEKLTCD